MTSLLRLPEGAAILALGLLASGCMRASDGDQQMALAGQALPRPLVTTVTLEDGVTPVKGLGIGWSTSGGQLSTTSTTTDVAGRTGVSLRLPPAVGPVRVVASAPPGVEVKGSPLTFNVWAADAGSMELLRLHNVTRAQRGLPPLIGHAGLCGVAQGWSNVMAGEARLYHNPAMVPQIAAVNPFWGGIGENVGVGGSVSAVYGAFLASPLHYANIVGDFTHVGIATTTRDGRIWMTIDFMR